VLGCVCVVFFSVWEKQQILNTSTVTSKAFEGPLIDLSYWIVFLVFLMANASKAIERIYDTWGKTETIDEKTKLKSERGVSVLELIIFVAIWGSFLSGGQQRILDTFVFEGVKKPVVDSTIKP
jgi:hypothetical protein